jgi:hypothetical protein
VEADDVDLDTWAAYAGGDDPRRQELARRDAEQGTAPDGWRGFARALREFGRDADV